jgi:hypothetical protein
MPFPISIDGVVLLEQSAENRDKPRDIFVRIEKMLHSRGASSIDFDQNIIKFSAGLFRTVMKTNVLLPVRWGLISVYFERNRLRPEYHLNMMELLVTSLLISIYFGWFDNSCNTSGDVSSVSRFMLIALAASLWFFGMNYFITWFRFPHWLEFGLRDAPKSIASDT